VARAEEGRWRIVSTISLNRDDGIEQRIVSIISLNRDNLAGVEVSTVSLNRDDAAGSEVTAGVEDIEHRLIQPGRGDGYEAYG